MSAPRRRRRGYLLAEATIGGAIMVTVFAACLALIAGARSKTSFAARRQAAAAVASATLDDLTSRATLVATTQPLADVDPIQMPGVRVGFDVVDVTSTFSPLGPVGGTLFEVTVRVEHPVEAGPPATITLRTLRRIK
jgi:hypothetical protein